MSGSPADVRTAPTGKPQAGQKRCSGGHSVLHWGHGRTRELYQFVPAPQSSVCSRGVRGRALPGVRRGRRGGTVRPVQHGRALTVAGMAGATLWIQLAVVPLAFGAGSVFAVVLTAALLAVGLHQARRFPERGIALTLAAFPAAIGAGALVSFGSPGVRFDPPGAMVAGLASAAFVVATARWTRASRTVVPTTTIALEEVAPHRAGPPLRHAALGLVAVVAAWLALGAPVLVRLSDARGGHPHTDGASMLTARESLVHAGGLALGLLFVVGPGTSLLRASPRKVRAAGGAGFLLWAAALVGLQWLIHRRG